MSSSSSSSASSASGQPLIIVSFNVNGLRGLEARMSQNLEALFKRLNADICCLQETKMSSFDDVTTELALVNGYDSYWSFSKEKKGWSGVVTYARKGCAVLTFSKRALMPHVLLICAAWYPLQRKGLACPSSIARGASSRL